ncbi:MAG: hypothetical protein KDI47_09015, partial [Gammaproteobacteria bacterium]|nr:hypothetical protein [Gammaproteobacteria bacterium]
GTRALHSASRLTQFLAAADVLWPALNQTRGFLVQALESVTAVTPNALQHTGVQGAELGRMLRQERLKVVAALAEKAGTG